MKLNNKYYLLRHGEAMSNVKQVLSSWPETFENPLTAHGREMIEESAGKLMDKKIDLVFASDLLRTKQTAQIVAKTLNLSLEFDKSSTTFTKKSLSQKDGIFNKNSVNSKNVSNVKVVLDKRLREIGFGVLNGKPITDLNIDFKDETKRINESMPKGETYEQVSERMYDFLQDIDKKYKNKNILIVSHECPLWTLEVKIHGMSLEEDIKTTPREQRIHKGQVKELN